MKITPLVANTFASDGGAMFGLVPKALWQKKVTPNDSNCIAQRANVRLIETEDKVGLVDTGCGSDRADKTELRALRKAPSLVKQTLQPQDGKWNHPRRART